MNPTLPLGRRRQLIRKAVPGIVRVFPHAFGFCAGLCFAPPTELSAAAAPGGVAAAQSGAVSGRVFNPATGEYVRNAEVRVQGTSILVFSGDDGTYRILNAPVGAITLSLTYAGHPTVTAPVTTTAGQVATRDFELTEAGRAAGDIVQMSRMTVSTAAEGNAKAMMEQRAAMNVKNIVASDVFGDLSEGNVGELLQYLPGVQIEYDQSDMTGARMGGMGAKYGALLVDGVRVTSSTGTSRQPGFTAINARSADMIELNKTASADMDADAPAGSINLASKSAFQRKGREFAWRFYFTGNSERMTLRKEGGPSDGKKHYQIHPSGSIEFSDTFFDNRLGVIASFDMTHVNHQRHHLRHTYNTVPTAANSDPIVLTQVQFADGPKSNRANRGNLALDYKLNARITLSLRGQISDRDIRIYDRNFTLITARNNLAPGSSASSQVANAVGNTTRLQMAGGYQERTDSAHSFSPQVVYAGDRLRIDAALAYSQIDINYRNAQPDGSGIGPPTNYSISLFPVSWRMQRGGADETGWQFQQLSGPDLYVLNNWQPGFPANNVVRNAALQQPAKKKYTGHANARLTLPWNLPTFFKGGFKVQEEIYTVLRGANSWSYVGPASAALVGTSVRFDPQLGGNLFTQGTIPWPDRGVIGDLFNTNPAYFVKNPAELTNADNLYRKRYAKEQIDAAYVMGNTQLGRLILQGGGRYEATRTAARIYERGVLRTRFGDYDNMFFSGAAKYRFAENFMTIVGYNQSIMRPDYGNLTGVLTVNDVTMVGNIPNPDLKPEYGENYFARVEYYLKSAGILSVGVFRRHITDLHFQRAQIPAEELGLEADYPGYVFTSWDNADSYRSQGYELEYSQQLSMLPGVLRGLGVFGNYTRVTNNNAALSYGNSPAVGSAGFSFRYRGFNGSLRGSWNDKTVTSATEFRKERVIVGMSASYRLPWRNMSVFLSGTNITKEPIATYRNDRSDHLVAHGEFGSNWTMGVEGRF
jgi:iron complex outermembrane receptor protein